MRCDENHCGYLISLDIAKSPFIALQCTYLLKQSAIPLMTGRATNGLKVGNFPGRMRGAGSPEPAHSTRTTVVEMTGYVTTAQQIT